MAKNKKKKKKPEEIAIKQKKNKKKKQNKKSKQKQTKIQPESPTISCNSVYDTLSRLANVVNRVSNEPIIYHGNSFHRAEINTLEVIKNRQPVTSAQLAEDLKVTRSAVLKTVSKLVHKGLIEKQRSQTNRRVFEIVLTQQGVDFINTHPDMTTNIQRPVMEALEKMSPTELAYFNDGLERILINLIH